MANVFYHRVGKGACVFINQVLFKCNFWPTLWASIISRTINSQKNTIDLLNISSSSKNNNSNQCEIPS